MSITLDSTTAAHIHAILKDELEDAECTGLAEDVAHLKRLCSLLKPEPQGQALTGTPSTTAFTMTIEGTLETDDGDRAAAYREAISDNLYDIYQSAIGEGRITGESAISLETHACHISYSQAPDPGRQVYQLALPGHDDAAGEGEDGVFWLALNEKELTEIQKCISPMGESCTLVVLPQVGPADAGVDYHGGQPGDLALAGQHIAAARAARAANLTQHDQRLPKGERCWITVENISVLVNATDEGVVVDLFPVGDEMNDSIGSTYAFYTEGVAEDNA